MSLADISNAIELLTQLHVDLSKIKEQESALINQAHQLIADVASLSHTKSK